MALSGWDLYQLEEEYVDSINVLEPGEERYIIDAVWMRCWSDHVCAGVKGPHPGPISNRNLLDPASGYKRLHEGLACNHDYRALGKAAWGFLLSRYGGGPEIVTSHEKDTAAASVRGHYVTFPDEDEEIEAMLPSRSFKQMASYFRPGRSSANAMQATAPSGSTKSNEAPRLQFDSLAKEMEFVKTHDKPENGEEWHIIDASWLRRWAKYVREAGPYPGPISNRDLLVGMSGGSKRQVPKTNLIVGQHYRGVGKAVWGYLQQQYGGGPSIRNSTLNIYTAKIGTDIMAPVGEDDERRSRRSASKASTATPSPTSSRSSRLSLGTFFPRFGRTQTGQSDATSNQSPCVSDHESGEQQDRRQKRGLRWAHR